MNNERPASSATGVALARALETALPKHQRLFEDPFAHLFLGRFGSTVLRLCRHLGTRRILLGANDRLLPGVRGISVGRTRFIDDALDAALGRGVRQVVILGAGYDTRALRIRGSESSLFFEVDHPATQRCKCETLERVLGEQPSNLKFVPVDLERQGLATALEGAGFQRKEKALVIWEGVTEYLSESAVDAALAWFAQGIALESEIVFTYTDRGLIEGTKTFSGGSRILAMNRWGGEPYRFGFDPTRLRVELADRGLELIEDVAGEEYRRRYFAPRDRHLRGNEYERTALARRAGAGAPLDAGRVFCGPTRGQEPK